MVLLIRYTIELLIKKESGHLDTIRDSYLQPTGCLWTTPIPKFHTLPVVGNLK